MAAISAAPPSATALTPPSSSHGNQDPWIYAARSDESIKRTLEGARGPLNPHNGNPKITSPEMASSRGRSNTHDLSPPYNDDHGSLHNGHGGEKRSASGSSDDAGAGEDNSKWIHRDKLARIECEELQAAGIMLPTAIPRPRKDRSTDRLGSRRAGDSPEGLGSGIARPKTSGRESISSWDVKTLEEFGDASGSLRGGANGSVKSRIPVPKFAQQQQQQPTTPLDERDSFDPDSSAVGSLGKDSTNDSPNTRTRSKSISAGAALGQATPSGKRSNTTDASPKKPAAGARKPASRNGSVAAARPKTRGNERSASTTNRPVTRSSDLSPGHNKRPEGDPPWMVSAYKPDPRLPPDQQLLPTVARRLQQEQWEKEGKFGNVYDKEFRPLNDDGFSAPPDATAQPAPVASPTTDEPPSDWPLRQELPRSPTLQRGNSYSTMPKISDKPPGSPIAASPKTPSNRSNALQREASHTSVKQIVRVPDEPEAPAGEPESKADGKGCGLCCVVM